VDDWGCVTDDGEIVYEVHHCFHLFLALSPSFDRDLTTVQTRFRLYKYAFLTHSFSLLWDHGKSSAFQI
jgi:hypothetical protein